MPIRMNISTRQYERVARDRSKRHERHELRYSDAIGGQPLREPVLRSAVQALQLPFGSTGLDVGCGIGLPACLLAGEEGIDTPMKVNEYLEQELAPEHRSTVEAIRRVIRGAAPGAKEVIAYGTLGWKIKGIIAVINPTMKYVTVAFLRGGQFEDKYRMLEGTGKKQKLFKVDYGDLNAAALSYYVRQAVKFDRE